MKSKTRTSRSKCPACNRAWPTGNAYSPKPLALEAKFQRGLTTITRALKEIYDQRGKTAGRSALEKLRKTLDAY